MTTDELILKVLRNSDLTSELRDAEIESLASVMTVNEYKAGDYLLRPGDNRLEKTLMILGTGEVEATAAKKKNKSIFHSWIS